MKSQIIVFLAAIVLLLAVVCVAGGCSKPEPSPESRAAIVDQLEPYEPNPELIAAVTTVFTNYGLPVDYYRGEEITVDFYRSLSAKGYRIILFRSHAGLLGSGDETISRTCLFTGEEYSSGKYIAEQLTDQLAKARINDAYPWVFAVGSSFVERSMQGRFPQTVLLMMGCSTLHIPDLAESMVEKGASACVGFDASIGAGYMDEVILSLVRKLCRDKLTLDKTVRDTLLERGADPHFGGTLRYYPETGGNQTLAALLK